MELGARSVTIEHTIGTIMNYIVLRMNIYGEFGTDHSGSVTQIH